jgi:hypothetical protein
MIEICRAGRERAQAEGFATTPINPRHASRLKSLREREGACMPGKGGLCTICGTGDCKRRPE